jgi:hypothetical protein
MALGPNLWESSTTRVQTASSTENTAITARGGDRISISNYMAKLFRRINGADVRGAIEAARVIPLSPNMPFPAELDGTAPADITQAAKLSDVLELRNKFNRLIQQLSVAEVMDNRPSVFSKGNIATIAGGTTIGVRQLFVFPYYIFRDYFVEVIPASAGTVTYHPDGKDSPSTITDIVITLTNAAATDVKIRCWHRTADLVSDPWAEATTTIATVTLTPAPTPPTTP